MAPPIERKKVTDEVPTPICFIGTAFCTTRVSTCMNSPSPRPKTRMSRLTTRSEVCAPRRESSASPMVTPIVPASGNQRYLPVRDI